MSDHLWAALHKRVTLTHSLSHRIIIVSANQNPVGVVRAQVKLADHLGQWVVTKTPLHVLELWLAMFPGAL